MLIKNGEYIVVNMVSRNKDNREVPNFKERRLVKFCKFDAEDLDKMFSHFVEDGVEGEMSRIYISINARNPNITKKLLMHKMIDSDEFDFNKMDSLVVSCASQPECAVTKRWLLDIDYPNMDKVYYKILNDATDAGALISSIRVTPHGYAFITEQGFDTRELISKWGEFVTVKKDAYLCYNWDWKKGE